MKISESLIQRLKNVHCYTVTPFKTDNLLEIDFDALARNLEFQIERGVQVIAVGGGTGEIDALTENEMEQLVSASMRIIGDRALLVACVPGNLGQATRLLSRYQEMNVQIVLALPPLIRGLIPSDLDGVFQYFRMLGECTKIPLMPYNTQHWPAEFIARLADVEQIIAIKDPCHVPHEFFKAIKLLGDRLVWIGNKRHDPGVLQFRYQMGMQGFTSGQANFLPDLELAMHQASLKKDWEAIIALQEKSAPLEQMRRANDDASMVKAGMDLVGLQGGRVRPPRCDISAEARSSLEKVIKELT
jgi:dihydrodipicolinate synthase/N-acetylneuraminate lyase